MKYLGNMKKFLICMICLFTLIGCKHIEDKDRLSTSDAVTVAYIDGRPLRLVTIGNHEYLYTESTYVFGICHYGDCKYCNNNTDKSE